MKKYIYHIFAALSALLLLSACQEEKEVVVKKPVLKVVSSDVIFGVEGGQGTIVVEADAAVTVTSERPWVQTSVSGNTITVTVSELNPSPQSRYSRLTIAAGSDKTYVTVHQFGEIFDGMKMSDVTVANTGTTMRYAFKANMTVNVTADQPWVHCEMDEENEGILIVTVDKHEGFGTRFATVSFTAGTNSGSMKITQEPTYGEIAGWKVEDTDGRFVFPDQIDMIKVTPPADMASVPYYWGVVDPGELVGKDIPAFIKELATSTKEAADAGQITLCKGADSDELQNLPSTAKAVIIIFDDQNYPTGQYALVDFAVPDRGPVKTLVDGWDIVHTSSTFERPTQTDVFTVTPKAGYEDVKYIATVVKKESTPSVEDFAFTTFAMDTREEILAKVASGELPNFDAGLNTGTTTLTVQDMLGDVYVVVVAFDDNQFYSGEYQYAEFAVEDKMPLYYRWAGKWTLTGTYFDDTPYSEVVTISVDEDDRNEDGSLRERRLIISGLGSKAVAAWGAPEEINQFYLKYDSETGAITFYGQNTTGTFTRSSLGEGCKLQLMSMYVKAGATSYTNSTGYDFMSATLAGESAAKITILERSAGLPWLVARIRCLNAENTAYTTTSANNASIKLDKPLTMTRAD